MRVSSPTEASSPPSNSKPLRSVTAMMADYPLISPKKISLSASMKRSSPSEVSSPPPTSKGYRRPQAAMMADWKCLIAGEYVSHVQEALHSHPPIPTTTSEAIVLRLAGSVEDAEDRREEDTSLLSPHTTMFFPNEWCGEISEQDVAEWEEYLQYSNLKWHQDNPYR